VVVVEGWKASQECITLTAERASTTKYGAQRLTAGGVTTASD
jgi:hypothetical protein